MTSNRNTSRRAYLATSTAAVIGLSGLAGCLGDEEDGDGDETVELWAWNDPALEDTRDEQAEEFESEYGTEVDWQYYPWEDYLSNLTSSVSGGSAPDSMALSVLWTSRFGDQGTVLDLEEEGFDPDDFIDSARDNSSYEGTLYAVPWYADCRLIAINREMFEDAGLEVPDQMTVPTWEEFGTWIDELADDRRDGFVLAEGEGFDVFALSNGARYLSEDGSSAAIDSAEAVEAGEYLREYVVENETATTRPNTDTVDELISETAAMVYAGSWEYGRLQESDLDWQYVPIPQGPSGDRSRSWSAGVYYSIATEGADVDQGSEWLEYLTSEEVQSRVIDVGGFPGLQSAYETDEFQSFLDDNPKLEVVAQEMENTVSFPEHPDVGDMWNAVHTAAERIWQDESSPQDALDGAADEINDLL